MLTKETLIANEALQGLSEEQIGAITTLSQNDENAVIGAKFGEVYRQMDSTIENATGIKRIGDEKTYVYLERASKEFASKFADYDTIKSENETLKAQVAKGGDEALKGQLDAALKELASTKEQFNTLKGEYDTEKANHSKALNDYKIDSEIARAKEGIKFKGGINDALLNTAIANAVATIKTYNPSFEERGGVETLVFHDANGAPMNNAENKLNPYTTRELLTKEFEKLGILDIKPAKGAGGAEPQPKPTSMTATTKVEADDLVAKMLAERGIPRTDLRWMEERNKIFAQYGFDKLPLTK